MSQDAKLFTLNRAPNPNAQYSVGNLVAFADAAGTAPVDGTGGSPTVSIARSEATPLEGNGTFLFTKTAANSQGQGFSTDLTLQPSDAAKMMTISYDYQITTGTYTGYQAPPSFSDITMWVYDVTNSAMYQVMGYQVDGAVSTTNEYTFVGQWQVPPGCLTARLIWFLGNTGASAFTARFNNICFGREPRIQGAVTAGPFTYTPTFTGMGTVTGATATWWRIGNQITVQGQVSTGTVGATPASISLPPGLSIDANLGFGLRNWGMFRRLYYSGTTAVSIQGNLFGATNLQTTLAYSYRFGESQLGAVQANGNDILASSELHNFFFSVPVSGYANQGTLGQDADTRVVAAKYAMGVTYIMPGAVTVPFKFDTLVYDTHNAATYGSGVTFTYIVPIAGYYKWTMSHHAANAPTTFGLNGTVYILTAMQNGSSFPGNEYAAFFSPSNTAFSPVPCGTGAHYFNAGDKITFTNQSDGTSFIVRAAVQRNWIEIRRMSGPAQIQAPEYPSAAYDTSAAQSISNATTARVNFDTKLWDTFGSVVTGTSWGFYCPRAGYVDVSANIVYAGATFTAGNKVNMWVYKNGVEYQRLAGVAIMTTLSNTVYLNGTASVPVNAGDSLDIRTSHGEAAARSLTATADDNAVDIRYQGAK